MAAVPHPRPLPRTEPAAPAATAASQVDRGRMLVIGGGCHDCHTPKKLGPNGPEADMDRMLMGHPQDEAVTAPFKTPAGSPYEIHINGNLTAWSGPWGVTYAANLTPDENTGIGIWTDDMFVNALQKGKHMGAGRPILPPMPWNWYGQLPPDDLKAILAYLKSIKPIANRVPSAARSGWEADRGARGGGELKPQGPSQSQKQKPRCALPRRSFSSSQLGALFRRRFPSVKNPIIESSTRTRRCASSTSTSLRAPRLSTTAMTTTS